MQSQICEFYANKTIFITGGTGFIGKVLIEKLLYSCSDIKTIYVLMKPKKNRNVQERVHDLTELPLFSRIRNEKPEVLTKLKAVDGNLTQPSLGLSSDELMMLLTETNIIFHIAATVNMQVNLKEAFETNVLGTQKVLNIAKDMPNLQSMIYASTAFSGFEIDYYQEKLYEWRENVDDLMKKYENNQLDDVDIHPFTNNYAFSKRTAELLIEKEREKLPITIVRPSIVTPSVKEPFAGWIDSFGGVIGPIISVGFGTQIILMNRSNYMEYVPVDIAANATIVTAWLTATKFLGIKPTLQIYNLTSSEKSRITYGRLLELTLKAVVKMPFEKVFRYPCASATTNRFEHKLKTILFTTVPFSVYDFLMCFSGSKHFSLRHFHQRETKMFNVLKHMMMERFEFSSIRFQAVQGYLNDVDKRTFNVCTDDIDWKVYINDIVGGARKYLLKQPDESVLKAKQSLKRLQVTEIAFKILLSLTFLFIFMRIVYY